MADFSTGLGIHKNQAKFHNKIMESILKKILKTNNENNTNVIIDITNKTNINTIIKNIRVIFEKITQIIVLDT